MDEENTDYGPCPLDCGRMTDDPAGGLCSECWARIHELADDVELDEPG